MTGNSNVTNLTNNDSSIIFTPPSGDPTQLGSYKTLTATNYAGMGGEILLNTYLGGDGSPSDRLIINSGTATGATSLMFHNTTGSGAQTAANGILVVNAINGGTTAPGACADHLAASHVQSGQRRAGPGRARLDLRCDRTDRGARAVDYRRREWTDLAALRAGEPLAGLGRGRDNNIWHRCGAVDRTTRLELAGGVTAKLNDRLSLYAQAGYQFAVAQTNDGTRNGVKGDVGLRYAW